MRLLLGEFAMGNLAQLRSEHVHRGEHVPGRQRDLDVDPPDPLAALVVGLVPGAFEQLERPLRQGALQTLDLGLVADDRGRTGVCEHAGIEMIGDAAQARPRAGKQRAQPLFVGRAEADPGLHLVEGMHGAHPATRAAVRQACASSHKRRVGCHIARANRLAVRPLHTNAVIFAFTGNALFAGIYYSMQRLLKTRMFSDVLSAAHFWGWQLIIVAAAVSLPLGMTEGKEYAELIWPIGTEAGVDEVVAPARPEEKVAWLAARGGGQIGRAHV